MHPFMLQILLIPFAQKDRLTHHYTAQMEAAQAKSFTRGAEMSRIILYSLYE